MSCSMDIPAPDRPLSPPSPPEPAPAAAAADCPFAGPLVIDMDPPVADDSIREDAAVSKDPAAADKEKLCPICSQSLKSQEPTGQSNYNTLFRHRLIVHCHDMHLHCAKIRVQTDRMNDKLPLQCPVCHVELNDFDLKLLLPLRRKLIMESLIQPMDEQSEFEMVLSEFYRRIPASGSSHQQEQQPICRKIWTFNYKFVYRDPQSKDVPNELLIHPQVARLVPQVIQQRQIILLGQNQQLPPPIQLCPITVAKPQLGPIPAAAAAAKPSCSTLPPSDETNLLSPLRMVLRQENQVRKALIDLYREFFRFKQQQILEKSGYQPRRKTGTKISDTVVVRAGFKRKIAILKKMEDRMQSMKKNLLDFNTDFLDFMLSPTSDMVE